MNRSLFYIPVAVFIVLVALLAWAFTLEDASKLPSALIDRPFPEFDLPTLRSVELVSEEDLIGQPALVNVWATWCAGCLVEHPLLLELKDEVTIYGINYNDDMVKANAWLTRYEDPYRFNIVDSEGKLAIDLGVYGAPETYVIDARGTIQYRHVGVITRDDWEQTLEPLLAMLEHQ
ncbi:MAG: DsbE family thiol:disulfide interchange protein [Pseudomonadota bacterium]